MRIETEGFRRPEDFRHIMELRLDTEIAGSTTAARRRFAAQPGAMARAFADLKARIVAALVLGSRLIPMSSGMDYLARTTGRFWAAIRYPIEWIHAAAPAAGALGALHALAHPLRPDPGPQGAEAQP
ncbi:MAG: hypothetical protein ACK4OP_12895 [Gemmobacter sp.]